MLMLEPDRGLFGRLLGLGRDPRDMTTCTILPIYQCRMRRYPVVPNHDRSRRPPNSTLYVLREGLMVVQELQEIVTFLFLISYDVPGELVIDKQCFFSSHWMRSY